MQRYTVYSYLESALHVSGGTSTHHQERIQLHLQHLVFVRQIPDAVDTVACAPDDGWKYHPKHVEQFPDINKQCNVASCWIYIEILWANRILHISRITINICGDENSHVVVWAVHRQFTYRLCGFCVKTTSTGQLELLLLRWLSCWQF
jgi:hypothetical protein